MRHVAIYPKSLDSPAIYPKWKPVIHSYRLIFIIFTLSEQNHKCVLAILSSMSYPAMILNLNIF